MADFDSWLRAQSAPTGDAALLLGFDQTATWPSPGREVEDYAFLISGSQAPDKRALLAALLRLQQRWNGTLRFEWMTAILSKITIGGVALIIFGIAVALILYQGIFQPSFLEQLSSIEKARGLITFLFALATISIFMLIAISIFWAEQDLGDRFTKAKDLLTVLVGILGTIMGFYFGAANIGGGLSPVIGYVGLSNPVIAPGDITTLAAAVSGGTAPYQYSVLLTDPLGRIPGDDLTKAGVLNKTSADGNILEKISLAHIPLATSVAITLTVKDAKGFQTQRIATAVAVPQANMGTGGEAKPKPAPPATPAGVSPPP